jgi:hypothetical protein
MLQGEHGGMVARISTLMSGPWNQAADCRGNFALLVKLQ